MLLNIGSLASTMELTELKFGKSDGPSGRNCELKIVDEKIGKKEELAHADIQRIENIWMRGSARRDLMVIQALAIMCTLRHL